MNGFYFIFTVVLSYVLKAIAQDDIIEKTVFLPPMEDSVEFPIYEGQSLHFIVPSGCSDIKVFPDTFVSTGFKHTIFNHIHIPRVKKDPNGNIIITCNDDLLKKTLQYTLKVESFTPTTPIILITDTEIKFKVNEMIGLLHQEIYHTNHFGQPSEYKVKSIKTIPKTEIKIPPAIPLERNEEIETDYVGTKHYISTFLTQGKNNLFYYAWKHIAYPKIQLTVKSNEIKYGSFQARIKFDFRSVLTVEKPLYYNVGKNILYPIYYTILCPDLSCVISQDGIGIIEKNMDSFNSKTITIAYIIGVYDNEASLNTNNNPSFTDFINFIPLENIIKINFQFTEESILEFKYFQDLHIYYENNEQKIDSLTLSTPITNREMIFEIFIQNNDKITIDYNNLGNILLNRFYAINKADPKRFIITYQEGFFQEYETIALKIAKDDIDFKIIKRQIGFINTGLIHIIEPRLPQLGGIRKLYIYQYTPHTYKLQDISKFNAIKIYKENNSDKEITDGYIISYPDDPANSDIKRKFSIVYLANYKNKLRFVSTLKNYKDYKSFLTDEKGPSSNTLLSQCNLNLEFIDTSFCMIESEYCEKMIINNITGLYIDLNKLIKLTIYSHRELKWMMRSIITDMNIKESVFQSTNIEVTKNKPIKFKAIVFKTIENQKTDKDLQLQYDSLDITISKPKDGYFKINDNNLVPIMSYDAMKKKTDNTLIDYCCYSRSTSPSCDVDPLIFSKTKIGFICTFPFNTVYLNPKIYNNPRAIIDNNKLYYLIEEYESFSNRIELITESNGELQIDILQYTYKCSVPDPCTCIEDPIDPKFKCDITPDPAKPCTCDKILIPSSISFKPFTFSFQIHWENMIYINEQSNSAIYNITKGGILNIPIETNIYEHGVLNTPDINCKVDQLGNQLTLTILKKDLSFRYDLKVSIEDSKWNSFTEETVIIYCVEPKTFNFGIKKFNIIKNDTVIQEISKRQVTFKFYNITTQDYKLNKIDTSNESKIPQAINELQLPYTITYDKQHTIFYNIHFDMKTDKETNIELSLKINPAIQSELDCSVRKRNDLDYYLDCSKIKFILEEHEEKCLYNDEINMTLQYFSLVTHEIVLEHFPVPFCILKIPSITFTAKDKLVINEKQQYFLKEYLKPSSYQNDIFYGKYISEPKNIVKSISNDYQAHITETDKVIKITFTDIFGRITTKQFTMSSFMLIDTWNVGSLSEIALKSSNYEIYSYPDIFNFTHRDPNTIPSIKNDKLIILPVVCDRFTVILRDKTIKTDVLYVIFTKRLICDSTIPYPSSFRPYVHYDKTNSVNPFIFFGNMDQNCINQLKPGSDLQKCVKHPVGNLESILDFENNKLKPPRKDLVLTNNIFDKPTDGISPAYSLYENMFLFNYEPQNSLEHATSFYRFFEQKKEDFSFEQNNLIPSLLSDRFMKVSFTNINSDIHFEKTIVGKINDLYRNTFIFPHYLPHTAYSISFDGNQLIYFVNKRTNNIYFIPPKASKTLSISYSFQNTFEIFHKKQTFKIIDKLTNCFVILNDKNYKIPSPNPIRISFKDWEKLKKNPFRLICNQEHNLKFRLNTLGSVNLNPIILTPSFEWEGYHSLEIITDQLLTSRKFPISILGYWESSSNILTTSIFDDISHSIHIIMEPEILDILEIWEITAKGSKIQITTTSVNVEGVNNELKLFEIKHNRNLILSDNCQLKNENNEYNNLTFIIDKDKECIVSLKNSTSIVFNIKLNSKKKNNNILFCNSARNDYKSCQFGSYKIDLSKEINSFDYYGYKLKFNKNTFWFHQLSWNHESNFQYDSHLVQIPVYDTTDLIDNYYVFFQRIKQSIFIDNYDGFFLISIKKTGEIEKIELESNMQGKLVIGKTYYLVLNKTTDRYYSYKNLTNFPEDWTFNLSDKTKTPNHFVITIPTNEQILTEKITPNIYKIMPQQNDIIKMTVSEWLYDYTEEVVTSNEETIAEKNFNQILSTEGDLQMILQKKKNNINYHTNVDQNTFTWGYNEIAKEYNEDFLLIYMKQNTQSFPEVNTQCTEGEMKFKIDITKSTLNFTFLKSETNPLILCTVKIKDRINSQERTYDFSICQRLECTTKFIITRADWTSNIMTVSSINNHKIVTAKEMYNTFSRKTFFPYLYGIYDFYWQHDGQKEYSQFAPINGNKIQPDIFKQPPIITPKRFFLKDDTLYIIPSYSIQIFGTNFRHSCYCLFKIGSKIMSKGSVTFKSDSLVFCSYDIYKFLDFSQKYDLHLQCFDHASYHNVPSKINDQRIVIKGNEESTEKIVVIFDPISFKSIEFLDDNEIIVNKTEVHSHGGYQIKITLSEKLKCLDDSQCSSDDLFLQIGKQIIKPILDKTDNTILTFYMPPLEVTNVELAFELSFDHGLTYYKDNTFILFTGVCAEKEYCLGHKRLEIPIGSFCDLIPKSVFDSYCMIPRKCPPGTFSNNNRDCHKVPKGSYNNKWGQSSYKLCPPGFICNEEGLMKYYHICTPGFNCYTHLKEDSPILKEIERFTGNYTRKACIVTNFCVIGVLEDAVFCQIDSMINTLKETYGLQLYFRTKRMTRFAFSTEKEQNIVKDLCIQQCGQPIKCTTEELYYDDSGTRSSKGSFQASRECDLNNPKDWEKTRNITNIILQQKYMPSCKVYEKDSLLQKYKECTYNNLNLDLGTSLQGKCEECDEKLGDNIYGMCYKCEDLDKPSITIPKELTDFIGTVYDFKQSFFCYPQEKCPSTIEKYNYDKCCKGSACFCPEGCDCDAENLDRPFLCVAGSFRFKGGNSQIEDYYDYFGIHFLDYLKNDSRIFKEYEDFLKYELKSSESMPNINDYFPTTKCIPCPPGYFCPEGSTKPQPCLKGSSCRMNSVVSMNCNQGTYNPYDNQYKCLPCPIGYMCTSPGTILPVLCEEGYYCNKERIGILETTNSIITADSNFNIGMKCPIGHYCPIGSINPIICPPGFRCKKGSVKLISCRPGTFNKIIGQGDCEGCPIGYYCPNNEMTEPYPCLPGKICKQKNETSLGTNCEPGYYCAGNIGYSDFDSFNSAPKDPDYPVGYAKQCHPGTYCLVGTTKGIVTGDSTSAQNCSEGFYNPDIGQIKCKECPEGSECPDKGMINPIKCKKGTYSNITKITYCKLCPKGSYGDKIGQIVQKDCHECPAGIVCILDGLELNDFLTLNETKWQFCPEGYFCPAGTTFESMNKNSCPEGKFCKIGSISDENAKLCPSGRFCSKGTSVITKEALKYCQDVDPYYCKVGDICKLDEVCIQGIQKKEKCLPLKSYKGTREIFSCYLDKSIDSEERSKHVIKYTKDTSIRRLQGNNPPRIPLEDPYETNKQKCYFTKMKGYTSKYLSIDLSKQIGFPPEHYNLLFEINSELKDYSFFLFEKNNIGAYNEIPLSNEAKILLTQTDYKFTIKLQAQQTTNITISMIYYQGPFFEPDSNGRKAYPMLDCTPMFNEDQTLGTNSSIHEDKDLLFFFAVNKKMISETINPPTNLMYTEDIYNFTNNNNIYPISLSLHSPSILSFIDYERLIKKDQSILKQDNDIYVYTTNQFNSAQMTSSFSIIPDSNKLFGTTDSSTLQGDKIVISYLPFITNCQGLGTHITFKDLLESSECQLLSKTDTKTFGFMNFFANAESDTCIYHTYCYYDELLALNKINWMQYDFSSQDETLFNISKYGLNIGEYESWVKDYHVMLPNKSNAMDMYNLLNEMIPVKIDTSKNKNRGNYKMNFIPLDITFEILYYNYDNGRRKIASAEMIFDDYIEISDKQNIESIFTKQFPGEFDPNTFDASYFKMFEREVEYGFMGLISQYFFYHFYLNTTQFNKTFTDYFEYKKSIEGDFDSGEIDDSILQKPLEVTCKTLQEYMAALAQKYFENANSDTLIEIPPINLINNAKNANSFASLLELQSKYEKRLPEYKYNLHTLVSSIYKFNVIIRPANWLEAIIYNIFEMYIFLAIGILFMFIMNLNYIFYWMSFKLPCFNKFLKKKFTSFGTEAIQEHLYYDNYKENYRGRSFKFILLLLFNNCISALFSTLPVLCIIFLLVIIFSISGMLNTLTIDIKTLFVDQDKLKHQNEIGRFSMSIVLFGVILIYKGMNQTKPDPPPEIIDEKLASEKEIRDKTLDRWEFMHLFIFIVILLLFMIIMFSNHFPKSTLVEVLCFIGFDLLLCPSIQLLFGNKDHLINYVMNLMLNVIESLFILSIQDLNGLIIVCVLQILFIFIKFLLIKYFRALCKKIYKKLGIWNDKSDLDFKNYTKTLNKNTEEISFISMKIMSWFIIIPIILLKYSLMNIVFTINQTETECLIIFAVLSIVQFVFDIVNMLLVTEVNKAKDPDYDVISIFAESDTLYSLRNSSWGIDSTYEITKANFRVYDARYELFLRFGFSSQLGIICVLFSFGFFLLYTGFISIISIKFYPWLDPIFIPLVVILLGIAFGCIFGLSFCRKKKDFWETDEIKKRKHDKVKAIIQEKNLLKGEKGDSGYEKMIKDFIIASKYDILQIFSDGKMDKDGLNEKNDILKQMFKDKKIFDYFNKDFKDNIDNTIHDKTEKMVKDMKEFDLDLSQIKKPIYEEFYTKNKEGLAKNDINFKIKKWNIEQNRYEDLNNRAVIKNRIERECESEIPTWFKEKCLIGGYEELRYEGVMPRFDTNEIEFEEERSDSLIQGQSQDDISLSQVQSQVGNNRNQTQSQGSNSHNQTQSQGGISHIRGSMIINNETKSKLIKK